MIYKIDILEQSYNNPPHKPTRNGVLEGIYKTYIQVRCNHKND